MDEFAPQPVPPHDFTTSIMEATRLDLRGSGIGSGTSRSRKKTATSGHGESLTLYCGLTSRYDGWWAASTAEGKGDGGRGFRPNARAAPDTRKEGRAIWMRSAHGLASWPPRALTSARAGTSCPPPPHGVPNRSWTQAERLWLARGGPRGRVIINMVPEHAGGEAVRRPRRRRGMSWARPWHVSSIHRSRQGFAGVNERGCGPGRPGLGGEVGAKWHAHSWWAGGGRVRARKPLFESWQNKRFGGKATATTRSQPDRRALHRGGGEGWCSRRRPHGQARGAA